jgi:hypothetical protein
MEYAEILNKADLVEDSCLRMAYIMGFGVSNYATNINRIKKPFNPLLGETYELDCKELGYRFISEQVFHHPPISVGFATGDHFEFSGVTDLKNGFKGTYMEVLPLGNNHVKLKKQGDHFVFKKCTTTIHNLVFGVMYIDHHGDMDFKNYTTGDVGVLTLKQKGWTDRD